ncbi:MAG: glycosyltransferase [Bacteroidota bacterium]|nr:glycosyltransferase [Bacteroidota bacterium]
MSKQTADVSIIAANYNNGKFLANFINSISESTILPKELIIIDDASTDNSLRILSDFSNIKYLKIIKFETNRGFCEALNCGVENATGKYILRIDPDDIICENRIGQQFKFLESNSKIDVVGSNVSYFNSETKKEIFRSNFPVHHSEIKKAFLKGEHGVQHPSTMIRTSVMKNFRYYQENVLAEDYELFAMMINQGYRFANIPAVLTKMRIHSKSVSNSIGFDTIKLTFKIRDRIFNTHSHRFKVWTYYNYILNYRKFLFSNKKFIKPIYLILAAIFYPSKLLRRIKLNFVSK